MKYSLNKLRKLTQDQLTDYARELWDENTQLKSKHRGYLVLLQDSWKRFAYTSERNDVIIKRHSGGVRCLEEMQQILQENKLIDENGLFPDDPIKLMNQTYRAVT